jgi:hypothetical protein
MIPLVVGTTKGASAPHFKYRVGVYCDAADTPVPVVGMDTFPTAAELAELTEHADPSRVLVLQRVLPDPEALGRLRRAFAAVVFDFDDAIYATPPHVGGSRAVAAAKSSLRLLTRGSARASSRSRPARTLLPNVDLCVAGNSILAGFAERHGAPRVQVIPTTVEPLAAAPEKPARPTVVWTGVPANLQYLSLIARPLERLRSEIEFDLTVVSQRPWADAPIPARFVEWSEAAQREALAGATLGVSPLTDDAWTRGKCAHRSLVFGAHGLPTVATPVGITDQVVVHGQTGFLARTDEEWVEGMRACLSDRERAAELGRRALEHVTNGYAHEVGVRLWERALESVAASRVGVAL